MKSNLSLVLTIALMISGAIAEAQQPNKIPRLGYLAASTPSANSTRVDAFRQGLRELGYVEGKNIVIEFRFAEGQLDRVPALAAEAFKVKLQYLDVRAATDIDAAFRAASKGRAEALLVLGSPILNAQRRQIIDLAVKSRLPTIYGKPEYVEDGGLIYYGTNYNDLFRRAATYVDKILKGAKPADLPVEQPTKFELVINLKSAKQIGLTISQSVLYRADKVIK